VTVTFQLPCLRSNYPNKPEHYISHLVGHEGPGSLLSALKVRRVGFGGNGSCQWYTARLVTSFLPEKHSINQEDRV
jgi:hypothetical protein